MCVCVCVCVCVRAFSGLEWKKFYIVIATSYARLDLFAPLMQKNMHGANFTKKLD
jgi:hypothetical protein